MLSENDRREIVGEIEKAIERAGDMVLEVRRAGADVRHKAANDPVTDADMRSQECILETLTRCYPEIPIVSEETAAAENASIEGQLCFLVDPLDGTKEFIRGGDDFALIVALVEDRSPTAGVIYAPERQRIWSSWGRGHAFVRQRGDSYVRLPLESPPDRIPHVLISRSHLDSRTSALLGNLGKHEVLQIGSALKFALIAEGEGDLYPRLAPTMLWDVAAGQAILEAIGGVIVDLDGRPLKYEPTASLKNPHFIAARTPELAALALEKIAERA